VLDAAIESTAARGFDALVTRYTMARHRSAELTARVKDLGARSNLLLESPVFRQTIAAIPALPVHATELANKLLDDGAHADEIVESIKNNPAVAGLVLKRVNSAYYGLATQVSDYYRALLLMGSNAVYQIVLESAVDTVIADGPEAREIQARAHLVSVLSYEIAIVAQGVNPLAASTIGLLHNIGDSLMLLVRARHPDMDPLMACVDAPALGAAVLATWGLPARVHQVVGHQDDPRFLLPEELDGHVAEIGLLYLARACYGLMLDGAAPPPHVGECMARLGLKETDCVAFCRDTIGPAIAKKADCLPATLRSRLRAHAIAPATASATSAEETAGAADFVGVEGRREQEDHPVDADPIEHLPRA
jgi:HD-like signal output (HDOD) protein